MQKTGPVNKTLAAVHHNERGGGRQGQRKWQSVFEFEGVRSLSGRDEVKIERSRPSKVCAYVPNDFHPALEIISERVPLGEKYREQKFLITLPA